MKYLCPFIVLLLKSALALDCDVVPIQVWSGTPSNRTELLPKPVNLAVIQHSVTKECFTDAECENIMGNMRSHVINIGFQDLPMSFLIGGNGKVYEGAGWHVGAHTIGYNNRSIGVSFLGDFRYKLPTAEALQVAQEFLACAVHSKNLGLNYHLVGHQQLTHTLSPGAKLQSYIEKWPHWTNNVSSLFGY